MTLALGLAPMSVFAQSRADGVSTQARAAFERGVAALDEGRFRDAIEALEASRAIRDVPIVSYDLALAYRGVGRDGDAIEAFERYLRHPDPRATPSEIAAVRATLAELRSSRAMLTVHASPSTAMVLLDGRPLELDANGRAAIDPGAHMLEASADGYTSQRRQITARHSTASTATFDLQPTGGPGRLVISSTVASAVVSIDGVAQPTMPVDRVLPSGEHVVRIHAPGYESYERRVVLGRTGVVRVDAQLQRTNYTRVGVAVGVTAGVLVVAGAIVAAVLLTRPRQGDLGTLPHTTLPVVYE